VARSRHDASAPAVVLRGATVVVALDPPEVVAADVVIADGRVRALGEAPAAAVPRDCTGTLVVPGNVCAHHHLYSALSRGMPYALAPPRDFTEILQRIWWRLDRALDEESVRASAVRGGLDALLAGTARETPQDESQATYFGGRKPEDGRIDWTQPSRRIFNLIRAVTDPYPGAFTDIGPSRLMVWWAEERQDRGAPGQVLSVSPLLVATADGAMELTRTEWRGAPAPEINAGRLL